MYDLILKGGTVIDVSQRLNGPHDLAFQGGKIASIAPTIPVKRRAVSSRCPAES